jgi:hypothetical protein
MRAPFEINISSEFVSSVEPALRQAHLERTKQTLEAVVKTVKSDVTYGNWPLSQFGNRFVPEVIVVELEHERFCQSGAYVFGIFWWG